MFCLFQKLFVVPALVEQKLIPFSRVNHNKYMVTDRLAYIGVCLPSHGVGDQPGGLESWAKESKEAITGTSYSISKSSDGWEGWEPGLKGFFPTTGRGMRFNGLERRGGP